MKISHLINSVYMDEGDQKKLISRLFDIIRTEINYDKMRKNNFVKEKITFDLYTANLRINQDKYGAFFHATKVYLLDTGFRDKLVKPTKGFSKDICLWKELRKFCKHLKNGPCDLDESLLLSEIETVKNKYHKLNLKMFEERHGISFEIFNEEYQKDRNFLYLINALQGIKGY